MWEGAKPPQLAGGNVRCQPGSPGGSAERSFSRGAANWEVRPPTALAQDMMAEMNRRFTFCSHGLMSFDTDATVIGYRWVAQGQLQAALRAHPPCRICLQCRPPLGHSLWEGPGRERLGTASLGLRLAGGQPTQDPASPHPNALGRRIPFNCSIGSLDT